MNDFLSTELAEREELRAELSVPETVAAQDIPAETLKALKGAGLTWKDVPKVKDLDLVLWESIKKQPSGFDMSHWHGLNRTDEYGEQCLGADDLEARGVTAAKTCGTSHCRAGWAVLLAGPRKGLAFERALDAANFDGAYDAGQLIYAKSRPDEPLPQFFCDDDEAWEDIKDHARKIRRAKV